jgi:hypothetical protein
MMLDHLAECEGIEDYKIICCVEPVNNIIPDLIESHPLNTELVVNDRLLGLWENKHKALSLGFNESDYVIHLEDDILLSQDGLRMFEFCYPLKDEKRFFTVSAYNNPKDDSHLNEDAKRKVDERAAYHPWGWAIWLDRWKELKENWSGQDTELSNKYRGARLEAYPILSRIQNVGHLKGEYSSSLTKKDITKVKTLLGSANTKYDRSELEYFDQAGDDEPYENSAGREVIKLSDDYVRTRHPPAYDEQYVKFWAKDYDMSNTNFYFDEGMNIG